MHRCLELAVLGQGHTAPNPMVGAVLVHNNRIIGEGYHQQYGQAHAEVNCINSVKEEDRHFIKESIIYVSLEPCAHHGKTPPCSDLIIKHKIPKVVVGCRDPFKQVDGKGIEKLKAAGIEVVVGVLEKECLELNKRFLTLNTKERPYIVLKWAQTFDLKMGNLSNERLLITNDFTNRLVHRWRSEEAAILVGTNTALMDNPSLTDRHWKGNNPIRLVVDLQLRLPSTLDLFNKKELTIIFNAIKHEDQGNLLYYQIEEEISLVQQILNACYALKIQSVLVEGGAKLLQSFINEEMWDEARVITNEALLIKEGLQAPVLKGQQLVRQETLLNDSIHYFINPTH